MNAGDGYYTFTNSDITSNFKHSAYNESIESHLIDNKGDISESTRKLDDGFSERLANFMKNSKNLLENIDKKHANNKFERNESSVPKEKCNSYLPESPTHTLVELEETLLQLDSSKLKCTQKDDKTFFTASQRNVSPLDIVLSEDDYNSNSSTDSLISGRSKMYLQPGCNSYSFSDQTLDHDYNALKSKLSLKKMEDTVHSDSRQNMRMIKDTSLMHSRNLTYSGTTNSKYFSSNLSNIVAIKLALCKKRTKSPKYNDTNQEQMLNGFERNEQLCNHYANVKRTKGFKNVINAILNQNHSSEDGKENRLNREEMIDKNIYKLASPCLKSNPFVESTLTDDNIILKESVLSKDKNDTRYNVMDRILYLLDSLSKNDRNKSFTHEDVYELLSSELNRISFSSKFIKTSSHVEGVYETDKTIIDANEKNDNTQSMDNTENSAKKTSLKKNYNFQEALRIDELENELDKMKSRLKEKDKKINVLESGPNLSERMPKPIFKNIGVDVNNEYYEDKISSTTKHAEMYDEIFINSSKNVVCGVDKVDEYVPTNESNEYSSIKNYNPNNSSALKNKIKDLESQIQDLQEANENAAQFMLSLKQKSFVETSNSKNDLVSELVDKNKVLREEVDRLHQSLPPLKGDMVTSQFLRQELDNLKEDLYTLKHQNNLIVIENIALKNQLKRHERKLGSYDKFEEQNSISHRANELSKPKEFVCNDTYELSNDSKDLSDTDNSMEVSMRHNVSNNQTKAMSMSNLAIHSSSLQKPPKKVCKIMPQNFLKKPERKIHHILESDEDVLVKEDFVARKSHLHCFYETPGLDLSNDSTDSILSDANKEVQEMIFQSELEDNIQIFSVHPGHGKVSERDMPFVKKNAKRETQNSIIKIDSIDINKFSTLERTACAPRSSYDIRIGDVVKFIRQGGRISKGLVHFVGPLPNRKDTYLGIELEIEDGKHDGIYEDKRYFQCKSNKGVFVAFNKIIMVYSRKM